ncbi:MAG: COX15/CtaA family protein [Cyclobacteriaceae bacterium]
MTDEPKNRLFIRLNLISIIAVYLLILVGGIVRSTGSGMGCPDWPKCFGNYIPPTNVEGLPENYKEIYSQKRHERNLRVASMMRAIGFNRIAEKITKDESILVERTFNPTKTWIEYINRLIGVFVGFFILLGFAKSFSFLKTRKKIFVYSLFALLLVVFQGWIGSIVVSTNLLPGMITFHMLLAIGLIALLIYIRFDLKVNRKELEIKRQNNSVKSILIACIILFLTQILLGTQVREAIDVIALSLGEAARESWINDLGITFYVHRSYSLIILLLHVLLVAKLFRSYNLVGQLSRFTVALILLITAEIATGASLSYLGFPFLVQPIHLFLALVIFGIQYYLLLILIESSKIQLANAK